MATNPVGLSDFLILLLSNTAIEEQRIEKD
jgi:hypothetical protein